MNKIYLFFLILCFSACSSKTDAPPGGGGTGATPGVVSGTINLSWGASTGIVSGYKIEQSTDNITYAQIKIVTAATTTTITGLTKGTKYYYRVRAYNSAGNSPYSAVASATP